MKTEFKSYAYVFIAGSLWGTIGFFVKFMERFGSTSSYTSFLRMGIGLILLVIITLVKDGPGAFKTGFHQHYFVYLFSFLAIFMHPWTTVENPWDIRVIGVGVAFALIPTASGYIFYFSGLRNIRESSKVPVVASIETVVATIIGILVFHEDLHAGNIIGIIFVLCSIAIMNLNLRKD